MRDLELFLANADDRRPVLAEGLPRDALRGAPRPSAELPGIPPSDTRRYDTRDPQSLPLQRWALIAPEGAVGDRLLGSVGELVRARGEAQGAEPHVYRVRAGMDAAEAARWRDEVYDAESMRQVDRARYLLILGDADQISWDLQHRLSADTFVGRLAFATERGYQAYADKVLRSERVPALAPGARALFFSALDGSSATAMGHAQLMRPMVALAEERRAGGTFPVTEIVSLAGGAASAPDALLEQATRTGPAVLFSLSHGLGRPRLGWGSLDEQHARQGAMALADGGVLAAEDLVSRPFLPGGVWFFFACYSAGTPVRSAYHRWLTALRRLGQFQGQADAVLAGLPAGGERSFVAALPKAVLENPDGPLAVIGHVDLAWSYSFQDLRTAAGSRPGRFHQVFKALADGGRAGTACFELLRHFSSADSYLSTLYGDDDHPDDDARAALKANLWMLRNDLRGYVLLGDPAARLSIMPGAPPAVERPPAASALAARARDPKDMERAVLASLLAREPPSAVARRFGIEQDELESWVEAYQQAGCAALAKIGQHHPRGDDDDRSTWR